MPLLAITDLNTTINHEPRIHDIKIGEALGFSRSRDVRRLIIDNMQELEIYGGVCGETAQTTTKGGRPSISYWLNEAQALLLCMFSKTEKAAEVRKAVIDTFMAWRKGQLMPTQITDEQKNAIQQAVAARAGDDGKKRMYFWSRFNNHFKIATYKELPAVMFDVAISYIKEMPDKEQKSLPAPVIDTKLLENVMNNAYELGEQINYLYAVDLKHEQGPSLATRIIDQAKALHRSIYNELFEIKDPSLYKRCIEMKNS